MPGFSTTGVAFALADLSAWNGIGKGFVGSRDDIKSEGDIGNRAASRNGGNIPANQTDLVRIAIQLQLTRRPVIGRRRVTPNACITSSRVTVDPIPERNGDRGRIVHGDVDASVRGRVRAIRCVVGEEVTSEKTCIRLVVQKGKRSGESSRMRASDHRESQCVPLDIVGAERDRDCRTGVGAGGEALRDRRIIHGGHGDRNGSNRAIDKPIVDLELEAVGTVKSLEGLYSRLGIRAGHSTQRAMRCE